MTTCKSFKRGLVFITDNGTFDCLNRWLRSINKRKDFVFGAVPVLTAGFNFLQEISNTYSEIWPHFLPGTSLWCRNWKILSVKLVILIFSQLLNRFREGDPTVITISNIYLYIFIKNVMWFYKSIFFSFHGCCLIQTFNSTFTSGLIALLWLFVWTFLYHI